MNSARDEELDDREHRRAGGARRRVARTRSPRGARGARRRLARARRAARRARARGRIRPERRSRGRGAGEPTRAHPGAAERAPPAPATRSSSSPAPLPPPSSPSRSGSRFGSSNSTTSFQRGARRHRARARRGRRGDADEDVVRLADRARRHGASAPRWRALLRGLAQERRRRARPDRDVQRGPERDAVGGRVAGGLPDADRHARGGRRRPGFVGREGARRNGGYRRLIGSTTLRRRSGARPAGGHGRDDSSPFPRGSSGPWLPPCRRAR